MRKCKILVPIACRSDRGITQPIRKRLKSDKSFELITIRLNPGQFYGSFGHTEQEIWDNKPDLIYIAGDRIEMTAAACAAFHNYIPIVHYGSGIVNEVISTFDDVNRHCIGLWATIALCEDRKSYMTINRLWNAIGKNTLRDKMNMHIVGNVYLDDWEVDESLVPDEPYDLVLINPTTTIKEIPMFLSKENTIIIGSNADGRIPNLKPTYDNLPRPQFLGLLSKCQRFISNSSCTRYEAPMFLKPEQIIQVGARNKLRSSKFENMQAGASDKIIEILKNYWRNEQNGKN